MQEETQKYHPMSCTSIPSRGWATIYLGRFKWPAAKGENSGSRISIRLGDPLGPCLLLGAINYCVSELDNLFICKETKAHWDDNNYHVMWVQNPCFWSIFSDFDHWPGDNVWPQRAKNKVHDHVGLVPSFSLIYLLISQYIVSNLEVVSLLDHS